MQNNKHSACPQRRFSKILQLVMVAWFSSLAARATVASTNTGPGMFFVATNGNDKWSGTSPEPSAGRNDGPLATLSRAFLVARDYRKSNPAASNAPVSISLRGGLYLLSEPVVLQPEDSNLTLQAYGTETPIISGGRLITGWRPTVLRGKSVFAAELPDARSGKWSFHELWVNGRLATCARYPKQGFFRIAEVPEKGKDTFHGPKRFKFNTTDVKPWTSLTNAEAVVMNLWLDSRLPIESADPNERWMNFNKYSRVELKPGSPYYLEGAIDFLEQPGEWCLDRAQGVLYYLPKAGESIKNLLAIAPGLTQLLRFDGRVEKRELVEHVQVIHLSFSHSEWYFPSGFAAEKALVDGSPPPEPEVWGLGQGAAELPAAVRGEGMRGCVIRDCAFTHLGTYALELTTGCQSNSIRRCEFTDLGGGAIKLGQRVIPQQPEQIAQENEIADCRIHDGGKLFHAAQGIMLFETPNNRVLHNEIYDLSQIGISLGWTWGYAKSLATNNLVAYNHIHHLGLRTDGTGPLLSDLAGIYTVGNQLGTKILNNLIHDIAGLDYGGWGLYCDSGSWHIVAQSNIVYRTTHGGFHQHYGATNVLMNNIFAFGRDSQFERTRAEPHRSFFFMRNLVYFDSGVLIRGDWTAHQYQIDWNLYFDARPGATPATLRFETMNLEQWRAMGNDEHSLVADPLFKAPRQGDFNLASTSPAFKIGFQPIDMSQVGIRR